MDEKNTSFFLAAVRREFSRQSLLLATLFLISLAVSMTIGADGLLEYFKVLAGRPNPMLEDGAASFIATGVAFLVMGMSISADAMARQDG
jgi:hypothetical protein